MNILKTLGGLVFFIALSYGVSLAAESGLNPYVFSILVYIGINIILSSSLNLVNGMTGQFSLGHAGFMSIGGYVSAYISMTYFSAFEFAGFPPFFNELVRFSTALMCGGLVACFMGYLVGLPSLRLKGDYLAIITLGLGEIIRVIILNIESIGGARGLPGIPMSTTMSWVYAVALVTVFFISRIKRSPQGRALFAVREDEIAAEAMGIDTTKYKVKSFMVGAFMAGVAGGLFAHYLTYLNPQTFDFNKSFEIVTMVVMGGLGSITGSVVSAIFLTGAKEVLRMLQEFTKIDLRMVIYSLMLVLVMLLRPNGLMGNKEFSDLKFFKKFFGKKHQKEEARVKGGDV